LCSMNNLERGKACRPRLKAGLMVNRGEREKLLFWKKISWLGK